MLGLPDWMAMSLSKLVSQPMGNLTWLKAADIQFDRYAGH